MKKICLIAALMSSVALNAAGVDKRLATVHKAFLVGVDNNGDDRAVMACLSAHLKSLTPLENVATKEEADVILKVSAKLHAGTPSARLTAEAPTGGTALWSDEVRYRIGRRYAEPKTVDDFEKGIGCAIGDVLAVNLRVGIMQAGGTPTN